MIKLISAHCDSSVAVVERGKKLIHFQAFYLDTGILRRPGFSSASRNLVSREKRKNFAPKSRHLIAIRKESGWDGWKAIKDVLTNHLYSRWHARSTDGSIDNASGVKSELRRMIFQFPFVDSDFLYGWKMWLLFPCSLGPFYPDSKNESR